MTARDVAGGVSLTKEPPRTSTTEVSLRKSGTTADRTIAASPAAPGRRLVAIWFWSGAALTFLILVVGGITRLTQSGLSMVEWAPIVGVVPPLGEGQWQEVFDSYRRFPEYQQLRPGMSLSEFKLIFFWEYLHRLLARTIGIVFLVPFAVFWLRGHLDRGLKLRSGALFVLGGLQGLAGWLMVSSGLVDQPHVSHYRLAVHLALAFTIFGCCLWFALDLGRESRWRPLDEAPRRRIRSGLALFGGLLTLQIFWGALVAGLDAGLYSDTFPLMGGALVPPGSFALDPAPLNLLENPITVQWVHRVIGTLLGLAAIGLFVRVRSLKLRDRASNHLSTGLLVLVVAQYALGVLTVLFHVPVALGVAHQAMAMLLFGTWLAFLHSTRLQSRNNPHRTPVISITSAGVSNV